MLEFSAEKKDFLKKSTDFSFPHFIKWKEYNKKTAKSRFTVKNQFSYECLIITVYMVSHIIGLICLQSICSLLSLFFLWVSMCLFNVHVYLQQISVKRYLHHKTRVFIAELFLKNFPEVMKK